jgi:hypothetical protein
MTNFDTKGEATDFAESVARLQEVSSMRGAIQKLIASSEDGPDAEPAAQKHELAVLAPAVRKALRMLVAAITQREGEAKAPQIASLRIRDEDPTFDLYCLVNTGANPVFFPRSVQNSLMRRLEAGIGAAVRGVDDLEFVGLYSRPHNQTQLELGARFTWSGNDG